MSSGDLFRIELMPVETVADLAVYTEPMGWFIVAAFLGAAVIERYRERLARRIAAVAWLVFGVFWFLLIPHFLLGYPIGTPEDTNFQRSVIQGVLVVIAVPACAYAGYLVATERPSLMTLSRAVGIMGAIYLPFTTIATMEASLIEIVTRHTEVFITLVGFETTVMANDAGVYNRFVFETDGETYATQLVLMCTGIGSIAIFGGLIAAVRAPIRRKVMALSVAIGVIWVLNVFRNAFIALSYGNQWFQHDAIVGPVLWMFGESHPALVSFLVADRILSQTLAVVALIGVTLLIVRWVPELIPIVEDALYVLTNTEFDLEEAFAPELEVIRADGGGQAPDGGGQASDGGGQASDVTDNTGDVDGPDDER